MEQDIRWQQRFNSLAKTFLQLEKAVKLPELSDLEREGMIQRFEFTYELAWKTLHDLLEYQGYVDVKWPRPVIEQALKYGILENGTGWMAMNKSRELSSHTYNEETSIQKAQAIKTDFYPLLQNLINRLHAELKK